MSHATESGSTIGGSGLVTGTVSGGAGSSGGCPNGYHKKLRRKRKELDALVPEDKVRRKSSSASHQDLLQHSDSDEGDPHYGDHLGKDGAHIWGRGGLCSMLPGALTLVALLTTAVGILAILNLLMNTRRDLDAFNRRLNAVEASGSELPAKFHESHVRLQQLEKNQSSVWEALNALSQDVQKISSKVNEMETSINGIKTSLSGAPQLSSLPKDVSNLQDSIATFGSSLQDAQSSIKGIKEEQGNIQKQLSQALSSISSVQNSLEVLKNETSVSVKGREGATKEESLSRAFLSLEDRMSHLSSDLSSVNSSLHSNLEKEQSFQVQSNILKEIYNTSLHNITSRLHKLELDSSNNGNTTVSSRISTLASDVLHLRDDISSIQNQISNVSQHVAVVKGVERKLEGSQVQMASSMSEIKQQIQKMDKTLLGLNPTTTPLSAEPTKLLDDRKSLLNVKGDHPRRKRKLHP